MNDTDRRERGLRLSIGFLVLILILAGRLLHLQVVHGEYWESRSVENRVRPERTKALRGLIRDRNGTVLATNRPSFSIAVIPSQIKGHPEVLDRLPVLLGIPREQIDAALELGRAHPYDEARLLRDVDIATVARVEERRSELPGVVVLSEPVREYPFGELGCHLIGYVGEIGRKELEARKDRGYRSGDEIGQNGLEKKYEETLRGVDGTRYHLEDAHGREIQALGEDPAQPGHSIVLTIDWRLETVADSALGAEYTGAVIALDPRSGEILALVSRPGFDPNVFSGGISSKDWERLNQDPKFPLLDRAIQSAYPPGSTYKLITAASALESRIVTPSTLFRGCYGGYQFGKRFFGCWEEAGHGQLALEGAIVHSCDTYFYQVGERMDLAKLASFSNGFGVGAATGIDLPQETKGLMPTPAYYDKRYGHGGWTQGVMLNLAIGQGEILMTPLQLAVVFGAIGTRGRVETPHVLGRVETWDGNPVDLFRGKSRQITLAPSTWGVLCEALPEVVEHGTGRGARLPDVRVAGKTGTAQNPHGTEHAWFVAYAPAEDPEIVVCVLAEQGGHGGTVAAPIARRVFETHFGTTIALEER